MEKLMRTGRKIRCRIFQGIFRVAIPLLPYRSPKQLKSCEEGALLAKERGKRRAFIVTDRGVNASDSRSRSKRRYRHRGSHTRSMTKLA